MIGSGFSRNALRMRPGATELPLADDIADQLSERLGGYCDAASLDGGLPRVAQDYGDTYGRSDLNGVLHRLVRDLDFAPGKIHHRLLSLPWRDVFSTNWDTLLERTIRSVTNRAYDVVRCKDDIPLARPPRIIKLHGSLGSPTPLIVTEDDYRTYREQFAPFVNITQQAMIENVFVLLGFSGEDPNFLRWSQWVRDNLGDSAPKIFLAGWLALDTRSREALEARNVIPIDLARHPRATKWPEHLRANYAMDWILSSLERARPYDVARWPRPPRRDSSPMADFLQPVRVHVPASPIEAPPGSSETARDISERVGEVLETWAHNRRVYPGWLLVPSGVRQSLTSSTIEWTPRIISVLPKQSVVKQIHAIHEIVWRHEILLEPLAPDVETVAQGVLTRVDCRARSLDGLVELQLEWGPIREAWRNIGLSLLTAARMRFDRDLFDLRVSALSEFTDDDADVAQRICHERCLWSIYSSDYKAVEELLENWATDECDPMWMVRRAALLFEIGRDSEATRIVKDALTLMRNIPSEDGSLAGPSREGWTLWSALEGDDIGALTDRWNELSSVKCHAGLERGYVLESLRPRASRKDVPAFDVGMRQGGRVIFSGARPEAAAYRAIRLCEVAALPPVVGNLNVGNELMELAAEILAVSGPEMATRLILRVCKAGDVDTLGRVLSRYRVASMSMAATTELAEVCSGAIAYALPRVVAAAEDTFSGSWAGRMRLAMEALSRLVVRLEPEVVESVFGYALMLYKNDYVAANVLLPNAVRNLMKRSWDALPSERRKARSLDVLGARIVGMDGFESDDCRYQGVVSSYPDPGELIGDSIDCVDRTDANDQVWREVVNLLVRGLGAGGNARRRASLRMSRGIVWKNLTERESQALGAALWHTSHTEPGGMPSRIWTEDEWPILLLPEPVPGLAEERFRGRWLTGKDVSTLSAVELEGVLRQAGNAISCLQSYGRSLSLSEGERAFLVDVVDRWSETQVPSLPSYWQHPVLESSRWVLDGVAAIISCVPVSMSTGEKLYGRVEKLYQAQIPGFQLVPALAKTMPGRIEDLALLVRMGMLSEEERLAEGAAFGLDQWLRASTKGELEVEPPPDDLVREIGIVVATRRRWPLPVALQSVRWVFTEGTDDHWAIVRRLVLDGLGYLAEELRYGRDADHSDDVDRIPYLRLHCVELALAMEADESVDEAIVDRWVRTAEDDPLPEVRHAMIGSRGL